MRYIELGKTGLKVSVISFGVYSLTGMYGNVEKEDAIRMIKKALDLGINFFDTADVYGNGYGEKLLREAIGKDENVFIATKVGYDFYSSPDKPYRNFDPKYIEFAVRKSIERLGRKIDLLQIHNPYLEVLKNREIFFKLEELKELNLINHIGVALGPEKYILNEAIEALNNEKVETIQFVYNMLEQEPGRAIIKLASGNECGMIIRVPHASDVLSEKLKQEEIKKLKDHRSLRDPKWFEYAFIAFSEMKESLKEYLDKGIKASQLALMFIFSTAEKATVSIIANNLEDLKEFAEAADLGNLDQKAVERLFLIYDKYKEYLG